MEEIRKVRKCGNSIAVSLHPKFGLGVGDYVKILRDGNTIIITRVDV